MPRFVIACTRKDQPYARFHPEPDGSLSLTSSYDSGFIEAFKQSVPPSARRWVGQRRRWVIDPAYAAVTADLCEQHLGVRPAIPRVQTVAPAVETRLITLEYLGRTKERAGGEATAYGWADGAWSLIFPEAVLRDWFEGAVTERPQEQPTLYGRLGIKQDADLEAIKSAYRRLAKQWHPDVNKDPDAPEQFKAVTAAYEVLRDPATRRKYDVGLALDASVPKYPPDGGALGQRYGLGYRAPLQCGAVLVEGTTKLGQFTVAKILQWEDIVDARGRTLVTSWPAGAQQPERQWI